MLGPAGGALVLFGNETPTSVPCTVTNADDAADTLDVVVTVAADGSVTYTEA